MKKYSVIWKTPSDIFKQLVAKSKSHAEVLRFWGARKRQNEFNSRRA